MEESLQCAGQRRQFGRALGDSRLIQCLLADGETDLRAARAPVEAAATVRDADEPVARQAAPAKYFATEAVWRIADRAVQIHGGYDYMSDTPVKRLSRHARLLRIFEGTS